ncbi:MAG: cephalosporin hydroxylase family protein [Deltaproteobacteria bacterium]|nr:cephalosporin hydroxylase family protein [Deltaproteobacteria bacterium]
MDDAEFRAVNKTMIAKMGSDRDLHASSIDWLVKSSRHQYTYHFRWMGLPIIQMPQDIIAMQELIWEIKPDAIVETGIARGGSLIFYASMLHLLDNGGIVVGVDIDIRTHNRSAIEGHPMSRYVRMVEGSAIDEAIVAKVKELIAGRKRVLVSLDSMHSHAHVLEELRLYSPLVTAGSYLVVFDTAIEQMPEDFFQDRPWGKGDNPWTAVQAFMKTNDRFEIDTSIADKLQLTVAPDGFLRCVKD